jgi:hypothetical protein
MGLIGEFQVAKGTPGPLAAVKMVGLPVAHSRVIGQRTEEANMSSKKTLGQSGISRTH